MEVVKYSNADLLKGIKKPEEKIIKYLYDNNLPKVIKMSSEILGHTSQAEDIFHEALVTLIENVRHNKFKGNSQVSTYLISIVKFKMYNQLKKISKHKQLPINEEILDIPSLISDSKDRIRLLERLLEKLTELSEECQLLLQNYYYENMSMNEIADKLNYSSSFVRVKKNRCMNKLKDLVKGFV